MVRVGQVATLYLFQVKMLRFKYAFHEALQVALNAMKVSQKLGKQATLASDSQRLIASWSQRSSGNSRSS